MAAGVYLSAGLFRVGVVVASELPRDRSTLLVRLIVAGPLFAQAIEDLSALPADAHERAVAERILRRFEEELGEKAERTVKEEEVLGIMRESWGKGRDASV